MRVLKDMAGFHDAIVDSLSYDRYLTDNEINYYWELLPNNIKQIALDWGASDTVFRDQAYIYFQQNTHLKRK